MVWCVCANERQRRDVAPAAASTYQFFIILRGNNNETLPLIFISDLIFDPRNTKSEKPNQIFSTSFH